MTRFVVLSDYKNPPTGNDKTTILAKTPDEPGALAHFLLDFHKAGINLTKIESRPAMVDQVPTSWFYIDFEGHYDDEKVRGVLGKHADHVTWLGSYVKTC